MMLVLTGILIFGAALTLPAWAAESVPHSQQRVSINNLALAALAGVAIVRGGNCAE